MNSIKKLSQQSDTKQKYNILLIEHELCKRNNLVKVLSGTHYEICSVLNSSRLLSDGPDNVSLIKEVEKHNPDILVIDVEFPKKRMLESLNYISKYSPKPIVMFSEQEGTDLINLLIKSGVTAYVAGETDFRRIKSILDTAIARFVEHETLKHELALTKNKLSNQRTVEQAKLLLMQNKDYSEREAYHSMRKMAMDNGQKVEDVAKNILSLAAIL
ncbi:ANTAR domain-containing protein [Colwellia sp. UCD-KL20]|uniref:ANTAR domain-containing response regulator n=1 Tax=Colwellia sp. UCD-KL20 TaxID=1917165 RepID=UPI0009713B53|nr:ANTAR domain-containing protein [Colwellia sp. UCD-KL20]